MAWSSPLTAVANASLTAAQWNASVRDNLLMTAPALATTAGRHFVSTGANSIAERAISSNSVVTAETTGSATYTNLTTPGPAVTVTTGVNAVCWPTCQLFHNTNGAVARYAVAVSGASSIAASDAQSGLIQSNVAASSGGRYGVTVHFNGTLTAGSNTFTMQYSTSTPTATFQNRSLTVMAL